MQLRTDVQLPAQRKLPFIISTHLSSHDDTEHQHPHRNIQWKKPIWSKDTETTPRNSATPSTKTPLNLISTSRLLKTPTTSISLSHEASNHLTLVKRKEKERKIPNIFRPDISSLNKVRSSRLRADEGTKRCFAIIEVETLHAIDYVNFQMYIR